MNFTASEKLDIILALSRLRNNNERILSKEIDKGRGNWEVKDYITYLDALMLKVMETL